MGIRTQAVIRATMELPDVDGPVWYGMPVLKALADGLRARGFNPDSPQQYEDADGAFWCKTENLAVQVWIGWLDEIAHEGSPGTVWHMTVDARRGCFVPRRFDPSQIAPLLEALHEAIQANPQIELVGWLDRDARDPSNAAKCPRPLG